MQTSDPLIFQLCHPFLGNLSLLLMADWLVLSRDTDTYELVMQAYELFGDEQSKADLTEIKLQYGSDSNGDSVSESNTGDDSEVNTPKCAKCNLLKSSEKEVKMKSQMESEHQNASSDSKLGHQNETEEKNSTGADYSWKEKGISEIKNTKESNNKEVENNEGETENCKPETKNSITTNNPANVKSRCCNCNEQSKIEWKVKREHCPYCNEQVSVSNFYKCSKGHQFNRCSLTLRTFLSKTYRQCGACHRKVRSKYYDSGHLTVDSVLLNIDFCPFCGSRLITC